MIYVYTSILNGWDNLRPPRHVAVPGVRFLCFTNVPVLPLVEPWEYRLVEPHGPLSRASRRQKILAHSSLPADAEYSIYHDGNLRLSQHPAEVVETLLRSHDWAAHRHPCRTCIYQEADVLLYDPGMEGWRAQRRDRVARIQTEIEAYRLAGYPAEAGLWANGFIVRRHSAQVSALNELWWKLYSAGGERDQLSFPVARRRAGVAVATIDANVYESPYVDFFWHAAWKDKATSIEFHAERDAIRSSLAGLPEAERLRWRVNYPEY